MSLLSWLLVTLAGLSLAVMVVSLTIARRSSREARATIFPIVREEETVRARRARIAASLTGVIAVIMAGGFFVSGTFPALIGAPQQATTEAVAAVESLAKETATLDETPLPQPTEISLPLPTESSADDEITPTAEQEPPATQSLVTSNTLPSTNTPTSMPPTSTPSVTASSTLTPMPPSPTPAGTPVPAPNSAQLGPITFATQITSRREPISPTTVFADTADRVYAIFPYSGMPKGIDWTQVWYYNGVEFIRGRESWEWGSADQSYVFTQLVGAGDYRLELYVNDELMTSGEFTVQGPAAVGGPENPESP